MRIEEGKCYRAANGEKVGPMMEFDSEVFPNSFIREYGDGFVWDGEGVCSRNKEGETGPYHLVALWSDTGPIRTVTRQEIIPGTYDGVIVMGKEEDTCKVAIIPSLLDADELTRAAAVLTALAGALRDEQ